MEDPPGRSNWVGQKFQPKLVKKSSFPMVAKILQSVSRSVWCHSKEHKKLHKCAKFQSDPTKGVRELNKTLFRYFVTKQDKLYIYKGQIGAGNLLHKTFLGNNFRPRRLKHLSRAVQQKT